MRLLERLVEVILIALFVASLALGIVALIDLAIVLLARMQ